VGLESHVRTSLDQRLQSAQREHRLPSVVAGLCRDGELVWSGYAGTTLGEHASAPGDDVQYRIGSITKTFVAVLVMRLRDAGRLELTDPVGAHVPGTPVSEARIGELLSHASGLQAETGGPWWERTPGRDFETVLNSLDPGARTRPGRRHHYSNVGYAVLGELIARLHGEPWDQVLKETLLAPLGLRRTTPRPIEPHATGFAVHPFADVVLQEPEHDAGAMAPAGTLWSTVADLSRWAVFLSGHTAGLLTEATLAEMTEPLVVADVPGSPWTEAYGLGLQTRNDDGWRSHGHGGSMPGFLAKLHCDAQSGDSVVVLTNATAGLPYTLHIDLLDVLATQPREQPGWVPDADAAALLDVTGSWYWGPQPFTLHVLGQGWLELRGDERLGSRFRPDGSDRWIGLDGYFADEPLRLIRHEDGSPAWLDVASFRFTRSPYQPDADIPGGVHRRGWSG